MEAIMGLKDINETLKLLANAVDKLVKHDLQIRDAAYREVIPALQRFSTTLKSEKWVDIGRDGEALAAQIEAKANQIGGEEAETLRELGRFVKKARSWETYETLKEQYESFAPQLINRLKELQTEIHKKLHQ
jgi:hypothetical protein